MNEGKEVPCMLNKALERENVFSLISGRGKKIDFPISEEQTQVHEQESFPLSSV